MPTPVLLAVDDDPAVRAALERDLRKHYDDDDIPEDRQYEVMAAGSGTAAIDLIGRLQGRRQPIALVLSDERMPGMSGVDLLTKVREITPDTKRVLLTAYADTDVAIRGVNRARLDLYLTKPWNPAELFSPIDDLLAVWRAEFRAGEPPDRALRRPLVEALLRAARVPVAQPRALPLPRHGNRRGSRDVAERGWRHDAATAVRA